MKGAMPEDGELDEHIFMINQKVFSKLKSEKVNYEMRYWKGQDVSWNLFFQWLCDI